MVRDWARWRILFSDEANNGCVICILSDNLAVMLCHCAMTAGFLWPLLAQQKSTFASPPPPPPVVVVPNGRYRTQSQVGVCLPYIAHVPVCSEDHRSFRHLRPWGHSSQPQLQQRRHRKIYFHVLSLRKDVGQAQSQVELKVWTGVSTRNFHATHATCFCWSSGSKVINSSSNYVGLIAISTIWAKCHTYSI